MYSEDGLVYDAEIIEICPDVENLCVVRYTHYGNEEQQYLTDLMPVIQDPSSPDSQGINIKRNNGSHSHQVVQRTQNFEQNNWRAASRLVLDTVKRIK